jgi:hypothetical protein
MTVQLSPTPVQKFFDNNGNPLANGQLFSYIAGTSTPQATWVDATQTTQNTNPVILNARGECNLWLDPTLVYKLTLADSTGNLIWTQDQIVGGYVPVSQLASYVTNSFIGQQLYPRTAAEIAAAVTPTFYAYPSLNVLRYGADSTGVADSTSAFTQAVSAAAVNGGTVRIPEGTYLCNSITVPPYVYIQGSGKRATVIKWSGSGYWCQLGNNANTLSYGCGIMDLEILLGTTSSKGVLCYATCGAQVERLYIEGPIAASRTTVGVTIDGANISSFFNRIRDVHCNHINIGFQMLTTGSTQPTCQFIDNCIALGDVATDASSQGIVIFLNCGSGSVVTGGDMESCGTGINIGNQAADITWLGIRFEANTLDIAIGLTPHPQVFIGLQGLNSISDSSGTGFANHTYLGCKDRTGLLRSSTLPGTNLMIASRSTNDVPVKIQGWPSQTNPVLQVLDSGNNVNLTINPAGVINAANLTVNGASTPSQVTGFGSPTGSAVINNFPGASATLVQCSNTIAEILVVLKSYGFIGA